jgi:hypothetical protein
VIRLVLAAIVFFATLCASQAQISAGPPTEQPSRAATIAAAPLGCTPDDDGEWRPQHDTAASIPESSWKWRNLHAGVAATAHCAGFVATALSAAPPGRASDAPSYLLHTPLLI